MFIFILHLPYLFTFSTFSIMNTCAFYWGCTILNKMQYEIRYMIMLKYNFRVYFQKLITLKKSLTFKTSKCKNNKKL